MKKLFVWPQCDQVSGIGSKKRKLIRLQGAIIGSNMQQYSTFTMITFSANHVEIFSFSPHSLNIVQSKYEFDAENDYFVLVSFALPDSRYVERDGKEKNPVDAECPISFVASLVSFCAQTYA